MVFWILAALAVFLIQTYGTAMMGLARVGFLAYVGPRDDVGDPSVLQARAQRALVNMRENMMLFLPLALLVAFRETDMDPSDLSVALLGAEMFVLARLPYALIYIWGVPWIRSFAFSIGLVGTGLMAWALI